MNFYTFSFYLTDMLAHAILIVTLKTSYGIIFSDIILLITINSQIHLH